MTYTNTFSNHEMAKIIVDMVRQTMAKRNDPKHILAPYPDDVKEATRLLLTHSERKMCGFLPTTEPDPLAAALRMLVTKREKEAFGQSQDVSLTGSSVFYYQLLTQ